MKKSLLAALNDTERMLVAETERAELDLLDEDAVVELHTRIRRARNKYMGQYRRGASARVSSKGGRGSARPANKRAALKAEAFEEALSRVSRRLGVLARQTANDLRDERLEAARSDAGSRSRSTSGSQKSDSKGAAGPKSKRKSPKGDRSLRSPVREKNRAGTRALGAKRQAKRDGRNSG